MQSSDFLDLAIYLVEQGESFEDVKFLLETINCDFMSEKDKEEFDRLTGYIKLELEKPKPNFDFIQGYSKRKLELLNRAKASSPKTPTRQLQKTKTISKVILKRTDVKPTNVPTWKSINP